MSYYEAIDQTPSDDDLWHVQLASGEVCLMTLDQLDDAFNTGVISENTYLWQEGATGWVTLREVAGLDADEAEDVSAHVEQENPFVQPDYASESVWPSAPAAAPAYNFAAQDPFAPPVQVMGPHSTAPVVSPMHDMDFDLEPVNFGRKKHPGRWLFAAALIGAAGFGAMKYNLLPTSQNDAPALPPAVAAIPLPVETAAAPPVTPTPPPAAAPAPEPAKALNDDVKARLASADAKLAQKQKQKAQQAAERHAAGRSSSRRSSSSSSGAKGVFTKGGETGDPLNSSL